MILGGPRLPSRGWRDVSSVTPYVKDIIISGRVKVILDTLNKITYSFAGFIILLRLFFTQFICKKKQGKIFFLWSQKYCASNSWARATRNASKKLTSNEQEQLAKSRCLETLQQNTYGPIRNSCSNWLWKLAVVVVVNYVILRDYPVFRHFVFVVHFFKSNLWHFETFYWKWKLNYQKSPYPMR